MHVRGLGKGDRPVVERPMDLAEEDELVAIEKPTKGGEGERAERGTEQDEPATP